MLPINKYKSSFMLLAVVVIITCTALGVWQLSRLEEKKLFIETLSNNLKSPPVALEKLELEKVIYKKIKLTGHFLTAKDIHLYGRRTSSNEKDTYNLLSPFQTENGTIVMVARGWFAASNKSKISDMMNSIEKQDIIGIALLPEKKKMFIPANDVARNVWLTLDLQQMSEVLALPLANFYLLQMDSSNLLADLKPLSAQNLLYIRNDHLEYAITWFSLAIALLVIAVYRLKIKGS